jgi:signal transduction histidine kinase
MSALVSDLNDNAKIEVGLLRLDYKPVDVPDIIEEVYVRQNDRLKIKSRVSISNFHRPCLKSGRTVCVWARFLPTWSATPTNILPEGGKILIGAEAARNQWDPEGAKQVVHLWVKDNGIGIGIEDQTKNFPEILSFR